MSGDSRLGTNLISAKMRGQFARCNPEWVLLSISDQYMSVDLSLRTISQSVGLSERHLGRFISVIPARHFEDISVTCASASLHICY
jgi:hypothetical protein